MDTLQTADVVARRLGISRWRVYELARTNQLPVVRLGRSQRFDPQQVENFVRNGGTHRPDQPGTSTS